MCAYHAVVACINREQWNTHPTACRENDVVVRHRHELREVARGAHDLPIALCVGDLSRPCGALLPLDWRVLSVSVGLTNKQSKPSANKKPARIHLIEADVDVAGGRCGDYPGPIAAHRHVLPSNVSCSCGIRPSGSAVGGDERHGGPVIVIIRAARDDRQAVGACSYSSPVSEARRVQCVK